MEIGDIKKMITVEYSAVLDSYQTRTVQEMIKENMDAMCDNRHPPYSLLYIAESVERAAFIITQIKRCSDPDILNREMKEFQANDRGKEIMSDMTFDQLMNKLNGK